MLFPDLFALAPFTLLAHLLGVENPSSKLIAYFTFSIFFPLKKQDLGSLVSLRADGQ